MAQDRDQDTSHAARVMADAVRVERIPGVIEFGILERALIDIAENPTDETISLAESVFQVLERDIRRRITDRALAIAHTVANERTGRAAREPVTTEPAAPRRDQRAPARTPSGLLSVLNRIPRVG